MSECKDHDFKCHDGYCVPLKFRCDGKTQCDDASDEINCPVVGNAFFFFLNTELMFDVWPPNPIATLFLIPPPSGKKFFFVVVKSISFLWKFVLRCENGERFKHYPHSLLKGKKNSVYYLKDNLTCHLSYCWWNYYMANRLIDWFN